MIITSISKRRTKVEVTFDDGQKIYCDYRTILDYGLRRGDSIQPDKLEEIGRHDQLLKIKDSALRIISRRAHSSAELRDKLIRKNFDRGLIESIVNEFQQKKYIDDAEFAKHFFDHIQVKGKFGAKKAKANLIRKGIDRKLADELAAAADAALQFENAYKLAQKKYRLLKEKEKNPSKIKHKIFNFLLMKGFNPDEIKAAVDKLDLKEEGEENLAG